MKAFDIWMKIPGKPDGVNYLVLAKDARGAIEKAEARAKREFKVPRVIVESVVLESSRIIR